ncbi:hypothetical protein BVY01_00785, partial [bacterium I07]
MRRHMGLILFLFVPGLLDAQYGNPSLPYGQGAYGIQTDAEEAEEGGEQAYTGWSESKTVTITGSDSGDATGYALFLDIDYATGMDSLFRDLRFSQDGEALHFWRESVFKSDSALFWVKVPSIPLGDDVTVTLHYSNDTCATDISNGDSTFAFFDDFGDESIDSEKWPTSLELGQFTENANGYLEVNHTGMITMLLQATNDTVHVPIAWKTRINQGTANLANYRREGIGVSTGYDLGTTQAGTAAYYYNHDDATWRSDESTSLLAQTDWVPDITFDQWVVLEGKASVDSCYFYQNQAYDLTHDYSPQNDADLIP